MQQEIWISEEEKKRGYDNRLRGVSHLVWIREMHGVSQLINSKTPTAKLFWSVILGICMIYAIINTILVTKEYVDNRTATRMTLNQASKLPFPTLVICPKTADAVHLDVLLDDIHKRIDGIDNKKAVELLAFAIAGAGFRNFDIVINRMSESEKKQLSTYYEIWKANRTAQQMFHYIFEENGYTCKQMFSGCRLGGLALDCCDIFHQTYVLLRGRCFRMNSLYQERNDEMGKLALSMNDLPSATYSEMKLQQELIIYVSQTRTDVALAPQYHLSRDDWQRMRLRLKVIKMLPSSQYCSDSVHNEEKGTCFIRQWLLNKIIKPLNCTIVYLQHIFPNERVCDPLVIIRHYGNVTDTYFGKYECLPACKRIDPSIEMTNSVFADKSIKKHPYRLEVSYSELQYDSYQEIVTTTLPGFVSQIGGQMGLFLGMSIITLVQLSVSLTQTLHRRLLKRCRK